MFDLDLQREIREANKPFLEQASERAEAEEEAAREPPSLSDLDDALPFVHMGELSRDALNRYRDSAGITDATASAAFFRRLRHLGLVQEDANGRTAPTGFGLSLFGQDPRTVLPQAGVLATIHFAGGREAVWDFDGLRCSRPRRPCNGCSTGRPIPSTAPVPDEWKLVRSSSRWFGRGWPTRSSTVTTPSAEPSARSSYRTTRSR